LQDVNKFALFELISSFNYLELGMQKLVLPFELELNGVKMSVLEINLPGYTAFRVTFSSPRPPIVVARATDFNAGKFWTSIPEGRQREAEGVGKLIEDYIKAKQQ
jgi:hypothetical protein